MNPTCWLILAFGVVGILFLVFLFTQVKQPRSKPSRWPAVCEVWNRWLLLKKDRINDTMRQFGDSWVGNVCPKTRYFQSFNRNDAACVARPEEGTVALCQKQISNDNVAMAVEATQNPAEDKASTDHWVSLLEDIRMQGVQKGNAWEHNNVCPSGAAFQQLEDELWCVVASDVPAFTSEAQKPKQ
jgi:hypothetical protein